MSYAVTKTLLIMAGGTGGHVYPALATADILKSQHVHVEWLGTKKGIEAQLVPNEGIVLHSIEVSGLRGKGVLKYLMAPVVLLNAIFQAHKVIKAVKPDAVLGMGGFASGPGGLAAWLMRVPVIIHEQNALPGLTNKVLAKIARRVYQAFPDALCKDSPDVTIGNPVRGAILSLQDPETRYGQRRDNLRLLVLGGSLGAKAINEMVPAVIATQPRQERPHIWHQTGKAHFEATQAIYAQHDVEATLCAYIDKMDEALGWADLVICRAGALTVSELAIAGVAAILIPFPYAVDDHQTANARFLVDAEAAVLAQQADLTVERLRELFQQLSDRNQLQTMAIKARQQAKPMASEQLAQYCLEVMQ